ncbi:hypothetical protein D3C84_945930 [compost metagenome]
MVGQQDDRQIGPCRLLFDQPEQRFQIAAQQGLRRHEQQAGAFLQLLAKSRQVGTDDTAEPRFIEQHQGYLAVTSQGRKNDRTLGRRFIDNHGLSSPSRGLLAPR